MYQDKGDARHKFRLEEPMLTMSRLLWCTFGSGANVRKCKRNFWVFPGALTRTPWHHHTPRKSVTITTPPPFRGHDHNDSHDGEENDQLQRKEALSDYPTMIPRIFSPTPGPRE